MNIVISSPQRIAWAFRTSSPNLVTTANHWMKAMRSKEYSSYTRIYQRYYGDKAQSKRVHESEFYSLSTGTITPFDSLFKVAETPIFSWTLLAALAYQESRFDPSAESWNGAIGLMQLLPATILSMGESNGKVPSQSIRASAKYLETLRSTYWKALPDSEAIKFTLASYNAGVAHILDAQRLAKELNLNPLIWKNNVEKAALKLTDRAYFYNPVVKYGYCRCNETYHFVTQIIDRTATYDRFISEAKEEQRRDSLRISATKPSGLTVAESK